MDCPIFLWNSFSRFRVSGSLLDFLGVFEIGVGFVGDFSIGMLLFKRGSRARGRLGDVLVFTSGMGTSFWPPLPLLLSIKSNVTLGLFAYEPSSRDSRVRFATRVLRPVHRVLPLRIHEVGLSH
jgi:hypothetical protein